jgi:hypothetical protein
MSGNIYGPCLVYELPNNSAVVQAGEIDAQCLSSGRIDSALTNQEPTQTFQLLFSLS